MILADGTIREYLQNGKITFGTEVDPADIRPTGIRLHLDADLMIPIEGQYVDIERDKRVAHRLITMDEDEGFVMEPGQFMLASTRERFQVSRDLVCHVEGRSTIARMGLAIHCTSGIIDGNFEEPRSIVLEMSNHGPLRLVLRPGLAIAMLVLSQLTAPIEQAVQQQYQGQIGVQAPNLSLQKR